MFGGYLSLSVVVGLAGMVATVYYKSYYGTAFSCRLDNLDLSGIYYIKDVLRWDSKKKHNTESKKGMTRNLETEKIIF